MNKTKTNYLIVILNIIALVSIYLLYFTTGYLTDTMMTGPEGPKNIYNNSIIECLLINIKTIMIVLELGLIIPNIVSAIQNRKNKKLSFWFLTFGIIELSSLMDQTFLSDYSDINKWINIILFVITPIIFAIKNLIFIKKNNCTKLQIISYILAICVAIFEIFGLIGAGTSWIIISIIMQIIYIHNQQNYDTESKSRKITNIILYYIIQTLIVSIYTFMVIYSLLYAKIKETKWNNQLSQLYDNLANLQGITNEELYIPVEKNLKYGFINQKGQEKIPCQYDQITFFNEIEINNSKYYIALAKKNNESYIISKDNDALVIDKDLKKYLQTIEDYFGNTMNKSFNTEGNTTTIFKNDFFLQVLTRGEINLFHQTIVKNYHSTGAEVKLIQKGSNYIYKNSKYSMLIEPINSEDYDSDTNEDTKYKVTIEKPNEEKQTSIVYLPGIDEEESILETFTNGCIEFESEDNSEVGWYDEEGNQNSIPSKYKIEDLKDDKVILRIDNEDSYDENTKMESNYIIINTEGNIVLQTTALDIYSNMYLVKNDNKKMILMDKNLKTISKEYDKIITTQEVDITEAYSSYY